MVRFGRDTASGDVKAVRKHRPDYQIVLFMGLLMLLGLIVIYAIGPQRAHVLNLSYGSDYSDSYFFIRQSISLALAVGIFLVMTRIPYTFIEKYSKHIFIAGITACLLLAIAGWTHMGIAQCSLGACRWFNLGPLGSVQPAELLKFGLLIFSAVFISMRAKLGLINDMYKTLIPLGAMLGIVAIFIIGIQKDMGTGIAMVAIIASMLLVAGLKVRVGLALVGVALLMGMLLIIVAPHRMDRITTFLAGDSSSSTDAGAYHIEQAKTAIGSGGWSGVGIGNSVQATGYLPEAINDSVFAIMGEMFGFIGLIVVLIVFCGLLMRLLLTSDRLQGMTEKLIVVGVFGWLGAHVVLNIAAMTAVFPLTGITLPFLSFGGTSMIFIAGALGLAFQLSSYTMHTINQEGDDYENSRSRRGVGRTRYSGRSSNR